MFVFIYRSFSRNVYFSSLSRSFRFPFSFICWPKCEPSHHDTGIENSPLDFVFPERKRRTSRKEGAGKLGKSKRLWEINDKIWNNFNNDLLSHCRFRSLGDSIDAKRLSRSNAERRMDAKYRMSYEICSYIELDRDFYKI